MALFGLLPQGAMGMVNQVFNPATQAAPQQAAMQQNAFQPSPIGIPGMLGIKGGFRDALGSIGDALLIANNADPMYGPAKQKQQLDHAMGGFADNPMEAIKRVSAIDPELGRKMYMEQVEADQKAEKSKLDGTKTQFDIRKEALGVMGGLVGAVNEATFGPIQQRLLELDRDAGLGLADVIKGARTPEELQTVAQAAITADQRVDNERDQEYKDTRIDQFERGLDRQERVADSQISSRATRDSIAERAERRQERNTRSQIRTRENPPAKKGGKADSAPTISGTLPASRIPASARTGTMNGRRIAKVGDKIYYIGN